MSIRRHTAYNVVGNVVPMLATLFTLPVYLRTVGEDRYGVLIILWTLLGYFGLFDLGLGRAVTNRIAALSQATPREREEVFWTALLMNLALGVVGALVMWAVGAIVFDHFVTVPGALTGELRAALPWLVAAFPLLLAASVMSGALMGREEFLAQNAVNVVAGILFQVVPLAVALLVSPHLPALVIAVMGVRVLSALGLFALCLRQLPVGLVPRVARSHVRPLFGFGGWVTLTSIVGPLLDTIDRVVIGAVAGVKAVTYYNVPFSLAARITIIPGSLSTALFPRFSAVGTGERDELLGTAVRSLVVIITPLVVGGMLIMEPFLRWWVGADFALRAAPVGEILVVGLWANCLAYLPFALIQGQGRPDLAAKFHLYELLPYLGTLWLMMHWMGVVGAAIAWSLRVWADAVLMFWASSFRRFGTMLGGMVVLGVAAVTVVGTPGTQLTGLLVRGAVVLGAFLWAWSVAPPFLKGLLHEGMGRMRLAGADTRGGP